VTNKEINIRSIIFLVIGILLVLSLVICIYIVNSQRDLKSVEAIVTNVKEDKDGTGKNDVTVIYEVDGTSYKYSFYYRDDIRVDDKLNIFYHEKTPNEVQAYRVSKYIFICPVIGLILCIYGLFELFTKSKEHDDSDEDVNTKLIGEDDTTQQFAIITDAAADNLAIAVQNEEEVPVKEINVPKERDTEKIELPVLGGMRKVMPKDYYIAGSTLVYEELGKDREEISFNDVREVIKTINSYNELVKVTVVTDHVKCVLTKMGKDDMETIANTIHNKMVVVDPGFVETIEYKEF
jgi:hypothetical protein